MMIEGDGGGGIEGVDDWRRRRKWEGRRELMIGGDGDGGGGMEGVIGIDI